MAANYPSDHLLFALVRIEDEKCRFPDEKVRKEVEDRIQAPFIGTAEDDMIIYTMLDLEQYLGRKINWVTGVTYDYFIKRMSGGAVPNVHQRGCTGVLKLEPMALWWLCNVGEPIKMQIGFRSNEAHRANNLISKLNKEGIKEIKMATAMKKTKTRWQKVNGVFPWQSPTFPLIEDGILKQDITKYWEGKPVRFADYNNCVGCFHRVPLFLAKMFDAHPNKMQWFADQEKTNNWRPGITYEEIKKFRIQRSLSFDDLGGCASGYCEVA